jgi:hypothetical protein
MNCLVVIRRLGYKAFRRLGQTTIQGEPPFHCFRTLCRYTTSSLKASKFAMIQIGQTSNGQ